MLLWTAALLLCVAEAIAAPGVATRTSALTNGERFRRGLGPRPPSAFENRDGRWLPPLVQKRALRPRASAAPAGGKSGVIAVYSDSSKEDFLGYVLNTLTQSNAGYTIGGQLSKALRVSADVGTQSRLSVTNDQAGYTAIGISPLNPYDDTGYNPVGFTDFFMNGAVGTAPGSEPAVETGEGYSNYGDMVSFAAVPWETTSTSSIMMADSTTDLASGANRNSIRLSSKETVKEGSLIIGDFLRMPWGCATCAPLPFVDVVAYRPAFWTVGQGTWPAGGEIDIVEGVNLQSINQMTLHTSSSDCKQDDSAKTTGTLVAANGEAFNAHQGGAWATSFNSSGISMWYWARADLPSNINSPDMSTWGTPTATWPASTCAMSFFTEQTIVFGNFVNALWEVSYVKVYSTNGTTS
ncbi:glycoside hydrolase family 16 protein [Pseudohyphozyma bogoriensis]|nr:glycoside hydrolase family 16 protein [Pseudohyphozyma bogoriensis]